MARVGCDRKPSVAHWQELSISVRSDEKAQASQGGHSGAQRGSGVTSNDPIRRRWGSNDREMEKGWTEVAEFRVQFGFSWWGHQAQARTAEADSVAVLGSIFRTLKFMSEHWLLSLSLKPFLLF